MKEQIIKRLSIVGIGGNILLSTIKFICGIIGSSTALIADAFHSLSDVAATFIAFVGCKIADKPADDKHPYGHEKFEAIATYLLVIILAIVPIGIIYQAITSIISGEYLHTEPPTMVALIAAIISIIVKEAMFWYTRNNARKIKSSAFEADAWHHRSDAISSIGALIGIGVSMAGYPIGEPIASLFIAMIIIKVVIDLACQATDELVDTSCDSDVIHDIEKCIMSEEGVIQINLLKTRKFGNKIYCDAEIAVNGNISLNEAHIIAHAVHDCVEARIIDIKHITVHLDPM